MRGFATLSFDGADYILTLYDKSRHRLTSLEMVSIEEAEEFCQGHNWQLIKEL